MAGSTIVPRIRNHKRAVIPAIIVLLTALLSGCVLPYQQTEESSQMNPSLSGENNAIAENAETVRTIEAGSLVGDQDKDAPVSIEHKVLLGETLATIAEQYGISTEALIVVNEIEDANHILPGQIVRIPTSDQQIAALVDRAQNLQKEIISDQELVFGPSARGFDLQAFLTNYDGFLSAYEEEVEGQLLDGAGIVQLVADRHSVNPRLLLAILEFKAGWLTKPTPRDRDFILGNEAEGSEGLYKQLSWAANMLNWGFYGRAEGGMTTYLVDGKEVITAPEVSDGTAGVQYYLASVDDIAYDEWLDDIGPEGFVNTYRGLFGEDLPGNSDPLLPDDLQQPPFILPWESGETWHFSGGPHGGWNSGSAWAALDFVPPDIEYGCAPSESWITAVADGVVTRSGFGAVVLDLDNDGYAGTGWAVIYMHLDNHQRIAEGTRVKVGERLGHPGCEGGFANGTHVHLARTYNGRWISADRDIPFNLSGWISSGIGHEYDGWLKRDGETKTADVYATEDNAITAD